MSSVLNLIRSIFEKGWEIWNYRFDLGGGFGFTLAEVAAGAVLVWIVSLAVGTLLNDDWGA